MARKTKGIYKRGNIFWICYAGLDGKVVRQSSGSDKYQDANAKLISCQHSVQNDKKQPETKRISNYTFSELAEQYNSWMIGRQNSAKVKGYIIGQLLQEFGTLPLKRFNTLLTEKYQSKELDRGLENASVNKVMGTLKAMFTKGVEWEMVTEEVLKKVRKVKQLTENKRLRYLSKEECSDLISACNDRYLKAIVITALHTGMRRGEILNLTWDRVDLKHGFILLDKTKNGERREIPIDGTLRSLLQGMPRQFNSQYVFCDPITGKPFQEVKRSFGTALRRAKILDFHFHDLRHTFASMLVMAGVDLTTVSKLLGHKDIKMTLRYAHLAPAHLSKAVDLLDQALTGSPTSHFTSHFEEKRASANA